MNVPCPVCGRDRVLAVRRPCELAGFRSRPCLSCAAQGRATPAQVTVVCPECGQSRTLVNQGPAWAPLAAGRRSRPCWRRAAAAQTAARVAELLEDIAWIDAAPEVTAARLGLTCGAIAKRLERVGLWEEARPFSRAQRRISA